MNTDSSAAATQLTDPVDQTPGATAIGFDKSQHPNCSTVLWNNLQRNPDKPAVTGPAGSLTYTQLCAEASRWGNAFINFGLQRGERIAFFLDDTPVYPAAFFGAVRAGFVPVLLNTLTTPDLLQFFLADTGARIALCEAEFLDKFTEESTRDTALERIVIANSADTDPHTDNEQQQSDRDFIHAQPDTLECADTTPDDMAFWMYSSGSTGRPKGIVHLQHDMAYTQQSYAEHLLQLSADDVCFSIPKVFFAYGFGNAFTFPFSVGATTVLLPDRPEAGRILDTIEQFRPNVLFALPTLYTALCRTPGVEQRDLSSLRLSVSAAETLSEDIFTTWQSLTGLKVIEGLGSTEMLHIYLSNTREEQRPGSVGKVVPGYEAVLRDRDGHPVAKGEEGIMYVRGHSSAPCYWNRADKTADTMRDDWIYTGDRFEERDGFYYFLGRADDLIKVSGQWVWPLEVEKCLNEHPHVYECAVLAHQLPDRRMTLRAVVRLTGGQTGDAQQTRLLQDFVKQQLLPYKYPRLVEYVSEIPKTGTGKVDRQALIQSGHHSE
ncbi:MAG: benzoate-CoA ligase family protein [Thiolinea sp.]